jgi:hypothetical protein
LGLEFGAISATAAASLDGLVVGVHVSTIYDVDTMLLDLGYRCQMGWPDAYDQQQLSPVTRCVRAVLYEVLHLEQFVRCRHFFFAQELIRRNQIRAALHFFLWFGLGNLSQSILSGQ